jgi:hypothetical protein
MVDAQANFSKSQIRFAHSVTACAIVEGCHSKFMELPITVNGASRSMYRHRRPKDGINCQTFTSLFPLVSRITYYH